MIDARKEREIFLLTKKIEKSIDNIERSFTMLRGAVTAVKSNYQKYKELMEDDENNYIKR
jgi:hypothetical protein